MNDSNDEQPADNSAANTARSESRVRLLLHLGLFQFKLLADGIRDLVLVPVSLVVGIYGIVFGGDQPDRPFRQLLALGERSDRFINLFNQHDAVAQDPVLLADRRAPEQPTSDELLAPYQQRLVEQAQSSKLTAKANEIVDELEGRLRPKPGVGPDQDRTDNP